MGHTVGETATLAGVTVRTLHHYDEIGLLRPTRRTPSGYRSYERDDLDRLFAILSYRELGFPLEDVAAALAGDRPIADHLREQRALLVAQQGRLSRMLAAIDTALEAESMGSALTPEEKFELFGDWLGRRGGVRRGGGAAVGRHGRLGAVAAADGRRHRG